MGMFNSHFSFTLKGSFLWFGVKKIAPEILSQAMCTLVYTAGGASLRRPL